MIGTTPVCERRVESRERRAVIWRAESVEEIKIVTLTCQKKTFLKNRLEYTHNILESAKNSKKNGPISVGCIGHKI
jgi:hypothetical protein